MDRFIVMSASCQKPLSCSGNYRKVAVIETNGINFPSRIDVRLKSIISIRFYRDMLNAGKTPRCSFQRALAEANELSTKLNALS